MLSLYFSQVGWSSITGDIEEKSKKISKRRQIRIRRKSRKAVEVDHSIILSSYATGKENKNSISTLRQKI